MTHVFVDIRVVECLRLLLVSETHRVSRSCRDQCYTLSQVIAGSRDILCSMYLLGPQKYSICKICWDHRCIISELFTGIIEVNCLK